MGMFDPDEDPTYIKMESQLDKIKKVLKADFLDDDEKLLFIKIIIKNYSLLKELFLKKI